MTTIETVRDTYAWDGERTRKVVRIGEQHFLISHSWHFAPEVAICRVPPGDDPDWDSEQEFWARTGGTIEQAEAALAAMTPEQYRSDEVDRPDYHEVVRGYLRSGGQA